MVFDIDGGLADMSPVTDRIGPEPWRSHAWQKFFAGVGDAPVIETGRELVAAVAALGFTTIYSTTRPDFTTRATRHWLSDHDFPPGTVFSRPSNQRARPALEIKLHHCSIIERRIRRGYLAAFVDDDPDIVIQLRAHGYAGRRFERLHDCGLVDLRPALVFGPGRRESNENISGGPASRTAHRHGVVGRRQAIWPRCRPDARVGSEPIRIRAIGTPVWGSPRLGHSREASTLRRRRTPPPASAITRQGTDTNESFL